MRRPSDYSTPWLGSAGGQGKEKPVGGASGWRRRVVPRWVAPAGGSMERANGTSCLTSCKRATEPPAPPRNGRHPLIPPPLVSDWPTCDSLLFHHCRIHYSTPGSFSLSLFSLSLSLSLSLTVSRESAENLCENRYENPPSDIGVALILSATSMQHQFARSVIAFPNSDHFL